MSNTFNARQGIRNIPEICFRHGLKKAVISPGSRNAPLILSFTKHTSIECLSVTDERSAGYFALGMSQLNAEPIGLVCTSGTAVLNLAPSVAEAYYQNLPLIVFTADRPKEWIDQADGQTIRQTEIFKNYIKQSFELPLETSHADDLWHFNRIISQAMDTAVTFPAGPVHINVPLREPLYTPLPEEFVISAITQTKSSNQYFSDLQLEEYIEKWNSYKKKMIIFGIHRKDDALAKIAEKLSFRADTLVIAENISNIAAENIIYSPETFIASLSEKQKEAFKPDLIITIGEGIVSKRLKQYLRTYKPTEQWHIGTSGNYTDTYKSLSAIFKVNSAAFLESLANQSKAAENVYEGFRNKRNLLNEIHNQFLSKLEMSDLAVTRKILDSIPDNSILHLANSTPIRYSQLFPARKNISYFCNRGTSGIDGCISTAAGAAYLSGKPVFIISGDLAFIYDSNGLWNNFRSINLKIVVINNNGGNIFSLIESSPEMDKARSFFETPHNVKISALAEAYGAGYMYCDALNDVEEKMKVLATVDVTCILEIKTDSRTNTRVFKEYYQYIKNA